MIVAYFTDQYWPSISGVSVSIDAFKQQLAPMGCRVVIFAPQYPGSAVYDRQNAVQDVYRFKSYRTPVDDENRLVYRSEKKTIYALLDALRPEIIHIHTEFSLGRIASAYAGTRKIKQVMTAHTNWMDLVEHYLPLLPSCLGHCCCQAYMRYTYNKTDAVVAPTSLMRDLLLRYSVQTPIHVIPTGIDQSLFTGERQAAIQCLQAAFPLLQGKKFLFFAGRLGKEKNISFLIDILAKLHPHSTDLMLVIAGDGPARKGLQDYAKAAGVGDSVLFTGYIERNRLATFYLGAEVFVFASKVESQGMVVLEAMVCGTPVVAIGEMGTRELMGGDTGGYMVADNREVFTEKVRLLLDHPELRAAKGEEARRHAELWTMEASGRKMLTLYRKLLEE